MLPQRPGVSFRGWVPDPGLPPHTLVTRLMTATSLDPVVATMGWSTGRLGVIVGRSGRDVTFVSEVPKAAEVTYLPGTMFHVHAPMTIDDLPVRVFEEYTPTDRGLEPMAIDPALILESVSAAVRGRRQAPLDVPPEYCTRFTGPLE